MKSMVGFAASILVQSVTSKFSFKGTLKSTRIITHLFLKFCCRNVCINFIFFKNTIVHPLTNKFLKRSECLGDKIIFSKCIFTHGLETRYWPRKNKTTIGT